MLDSVFARSKNFGRLREEERQTKSIIRAALLNRKRKRLLDASARKKRL